MPSEPFAMLPFWLVALLFTILMRHVVHKQFSMNRKLWMGEKKKKDLRKNKAVFAEKILFPWILNELNQNIYKVQYKFR